MEWLPVAQITESIEVRFRTGEIDVSSPWDEWTLWTLGRKNVESLMVPVLFNPTLMAHSFTNQNGVPRKFLDRSFPTWRIWTQRKTDEGAMCLEFSAAITGMGITIPDNDLQRTVFGFRVNGPINFPFHNQLAAVTGTGGKDLILGE